MSRPSRTERRRAQLALRVDSLEAMESRSLITESLGILTAGIGLPAALAVGRVEAGVAQAPARRQPAIPADSAWPAPSPSSAPGTRGAVRPAVEPNSAPVAGARSART